MLKFRSFAARKIWLTVTSLHLVTFRLSITLRDIATRLNWHKDELWLKIYDWCPKCGGNGHVVNDRNIGCAVCEEKGYIKR